jgi:hypothetical protein
MSNFNVVTDALMSASTVIAASGASVADSSFAAGVAEGTAGDFGDQPIGGTYSAMCTRAQNATMEIEMALNSLSRCVQAASEGYLVTDIGIMRASQISGAVGSGGVASSPEGGAR